jgi:drug/metabolite transporter (DMT)-like permease
MDDRKKAWLLLVATATLWSLGGLLIKSIEANPLAIAGVRGAIAAIIILAVLKKPQIKLVVCSDRSGPGLCGHDHIVCLCQ